MYDSFFGLQKRPFAATPDADCIVPNAGTWSALDDLRRCVVDGGGIGVLTAPPGMGKTLVCRCLARDMSREFAVVMLPSGNFLTRRSLLQAILFDLGHSYIRLDEQELRLALGTAVRQLAPARRGLVLIVDEAHSLPARLLEELRSLTNLSDEGEPLVRLVTAGQLALEETLSMPAMQGFNQRIGSQVTLQSMSLQESTEYVERRLALAGANISDVFHGDALAAICEASDGVPRNLNQLCDHSALLAYLTSERPISINTVREALLDLKQLPQSWNAPVASHGALAWATLQIERGLARANAERQQSPFSSTPPAGTASWFEEPASEPASEAAGVIEFGDSDDWAVEPRVVEYAQPIVETLATLASRDTHIAPPIAPATVSLPAVGPVDEEVVEDRYAALDARVGRRRRKPTDRIMRPSAPQSQAAPAQSASRATVAAVPASTDREEPVTAMAAAVKAESRAALATINKFLDAAGFIGASSERSEKAPKRELSPTAQVQFDVRTSGTLDFQFSTCPEAACVPAHRASTQPQPTPAADVEYDMVMPEASTIEEPQPEKSRVADISRRRYQMLFSESMRPRKGA